jgi:hypothetical protein
MLCWLYGRVRERRFWRSGGWARDAKAKLKKIGAVVVKKTGNRSRTLPEEDDEYDVDRRDSRNNRLI